MRSTQELLQKRFKEREGLNITGVEKGGQSEALLTYSRANHHKADDRSLPVLHVNTVLLAKGFLVIDVSLMTSRISFVRAAWLSPGPAGFCDELSCGLMP